MSDYKCPVCGETEKLGKDTLGSKKVMWIRDAKSLATCACFDTLGSKKVMWIRCLRCSCSGNPEIFTPKPKRNQEAKADAGKIMLELIPPEALEALGRVLTHGAKKYGANKWQDIDDAKNRYKGALLRHYTAYQKNNSGTDADSGLLHIEHALCNAMFLAVLELREISMAER